MIAHRRPIGNELTRSHKLRYQSAIRRRLSATLLVAVLAMPIPAMAHSPYEHLERVATDNSGRPLYLYKSYTDGIFFTDPVKLVVRDAEDRMVADTEYGRDISVICWRSRPCVVFRYDGFVPLLPENIWRLENGQLQATRSAGLVVLGVIAPLWTNALGYLLSVFALGAPFPILWLLLRSRRSDGRNAFMAVLGVGMVLCTALGLGLWLYVVVFLSYLSLPLVVVTGAVSGGVLALIRRAARRVGVAESTALKVAQAWAIVCAAFGGVAVVAVIWMIASMRSYSATITFEEPVVDTPLAKARVTRVKGVVHEVFVTVGNGVKLESVVNLDLFQGFDANMTREEAERRLGPPSGRWSDPAFNVQASYYDRREGRVSVVRQGASAWSIVGYPSACTHDSVFRDPRLRDQIVQWLPLQETITVHVLRDVGFAGLTVGLNRNSCTNLVLTARDGDPESR